MSTAFVPYKGTAGWSGTDTSKARAQDNLRSGREENNQHRALSILKMSPAGKTWKELATITGWHHGTASGVLSVLHKGDKIVRSTAIRDRCKVYFHPDNAQFVVAEMHGRARLCKHCGNDINA